jgi:hypothetical protein
MLSKTLQDGRTTMESKRAFEAMMPMKKIDVATIETARRGELARISAPSGSLQGLAQLVGKGADGRRGRRVRCGSV